VINNTKTASYFVVQLWVVVWVRLESSNVNNSIRVTVFKNMVQCTISCNDLDCKTQMLLTLACWFINFVFLISFSGMFTYCTVTSSNLYCKVQVFISNFNIPFNKILIYIPIWHTYLTCKSSL